MSKLELVAEATAVRVKASRAIVLKNLELKEMLSYSEPSTVGERERERWH